MRTGLDLGLTGLPLRLSHPRQLVLDFIGNTYVHDAAMAASLTDLPGVTFSRASAAHGQRVDGTFQLFSSGQLRRTNLGLIVEAAATNLMPRFGPLAAQLGSGTNTSDTAEAASPPMAGLNWLALDNALADAVAYQTAVVAASTQYTVSCLIEAPDGVQPVMGANNSTGEFRFVVGGASYNNIPARYERLSGNVWRVSQTFTTGASPSATNGVARRSTQSARALKFCGFQLETGELATSPIVTTGAAATRAADSLTMTGLGFGDGATLLIVARCLGGPSTVPANNRVLVELSDGTATDRFRIDARPTDFRGFSTRGGANVSSTLTQTREMGQRFKAAVRNQAGDFRLCLDGVLAPVASPAASSAVMTQLSFPSPRAAAIEAVVVIPAAFDDAALQALTA